MSSRGIKLAVKKLMENMDSKQKAELREFFKPGTSKTKNNKQLKKKASGGTVKRMGGGMAKKTKYRSKGGVAKRRSGGRAGKK